MCKQRAFTLLWVSFTCLFYGLAPYSFANKDPETNNLPPKNFISYPKTIKVVRGNENYPPYEFIEKGKLTGFHIDVITMVAKQMKLNIRFESLPWKRALKEIETGTADAISYITPTPTRKAFAIFLDDNVLSHSISGFLALKKNIKHIHYNGDLESLKPYRIGVQLGYAYGNKFDDTERLKKVKALSVAQMMVSAQ
jgi:polar amino acid transport system substrate-binding protein